MIKEIISILVILLMIGCQSKPEIKYVTKPKIVKCPVSIDIVKDSPIDKLEYNQYCTKANIDRQLKTINKLISENIRLKKSLLFYKKQLEKNKNVQK